MTDLIPGVQLMLLERLTLDPAVQPRWRLDERRVEDFAVAMADGIEFPPLVAFWDDTTLWLSDGFHRYEGADQAELALFQVDVRLGTRRDAIRYAIEANSKHGQPLTRVERQQAIKTLLIEFYDCTPREMAQEDIAIAVGVGQKTVSRVWTNLSQMTNAIDCENRDATLPQSMIDAAADHVAERDGAVAEIADDDEDDDDDAGTPAALQFDLPEEPEASPEERAFYALARQRTITRFRPEAIAIECLSPSDDLPGFHEFAQWLTTFIQRLEARNRQPLRVVGSGGQHG